MRPSKHEPTLAERLAAQAAARQALVARLKPKPHVPAAEVIPWDARQAERILSLRFRQKPERPEVIEVVALVSVEPPSNPAPESYAPPRLPPVEPIRFSAAPPFYAEPIPDPVPGRPARCLAAPNDALRREWKNAQWEAGNRRCGYCTRRMTRRTNLGATCTVDHRQAVARGGLDVEENWILACNQCNGEKGLMSEASFRRLLALRSTASAPD